MSEDRVRALLEESAEVKRQVAATLAADIARAADSIRTCLHAGGKVLLMGNGGSAGDAQHIAAELIGRFKKERRALPAIALTVDTSALTAIANDYGYDQVFSRQVEGLCRKGDVVIGLSTSGNSDNVIRAIEQANALGAVTIGLLGKSGGKLKEIVQQALVIPSDDTARIQESHITIGHILCDLVDDS